MLYYLGRGKKKEKAKNTYMMIGGSMMAALVMIFMFFNVITVTVGKSFLFTFITKLLVLVNWIQSSSHPKKTTSHNGVTILTE